MATPATRSTWANWQRRTLEALVALLAFAIWGKLAYIGGLRLLFRFEGWEIGGSWMLDVLSLFIGVAGSIAGVSAMGALLMRVVGRTPKSLVGAPDDTPDDYPQRTRTDEHPTARLF